MQQAISTRKVHRKCCIVFAIAHFALLFHFYIHVQHNYTVCLFATVKDNNKKRTNKPVQMLHDSLLLAAIRSTGSFSTLSFSLFYACYFVRISYAIPSDQTAFC